MNRVVLVNKTKSPTREEISRVEKTLGDELLKEFQLDFGGYIIVEGVMRLAPQWIVPADKYEVVLDFVKSHKDIIHELRFFTSVNTAGGGIESSRVA